MTVLIEKVDDDLYVNPLAVDFVEVVDDGYLPGVPRVRASKIRIHFRSGRTIDRRQQSCEDARLGAAEWQRLLNTGEQG